MRWSSQGATWVRSRVCLERCALLVKQGSVVCANCEAVFDAPEVVRDLVDIAYLLAVTKVLDAYSMSAFLLKRIARCRDAVLAWRGLCSSFRHCMRVSERTDGRADERADD